MEPVANNLSKVSDQNILISVIIPLYNEAESVNDLVNQIKDALGKTGSAFEIILVNDGSSDETGALLEKTADSDDRCRVVQLRRNFGQTAALMAGIDHARGEIIVPMDGDLQNDPADIPKLVEKLDQGYDVCSGWRKSRKDHFFRRKLPSIIANMLISWISGVRLKDYGCTLKAYRRSVIKEVRLYGEMHRFIPIYASWFGARVTEVEVNHRSRSHGRSKYGLVRTFKVILDLMVVKFMSGYMQKPIYLFGGFGLLNFLLSFTSFGAMFYYKFCGGKTFIETPLPLLTVLFLLMGVISLFIGLVAEILMRTYYESQHKPVYLIASTRNIDRE
ncbi:MAG: glycosyltransferase family 2 protein [Chitinispirillaceae bacterium]|nr:glycosyltransferase family 2 protein [Chitinispirillaceae bacterium]